MRRFFIEPAEIGNTYPKITGSDVRHIVRVLRHTRGDKVLLIDGSGFEYPAVIERISGDTVEFVVIGKNIADTTSHLEMVVAQAFLKEKKMVTIVRHLTELGISRWIPVISNRSVARPDPKRMSERTRRWESIAIESLKQCGLSKLPGIAPLTTFSELIGTREEFDGKIICWEEESTPLSGLYPEKPKKLLLVIGPEGGFAREEVEYAQASGFKSVSLGPRVLRAETAAIAACTLMQYLYGDMQKNP